MKLKLPTIVEVNDYHDFMFIQDYLEKFGCKIKYYEMDFADGYFAMFYSGKLTKTIKDKIAKFEKMKYKENWPDEV